MPSDSFAPAPRLASADWAMLSLLSVLWGGSFLFVGVAVTALPTFSIVAARVGLAALALWLVVLAGRRALPRAPRVWLAFLGMGLLNNLLPFALIAWGQREVSAGLASILNATTPLFTVLVAGALLTDERLTRARMAGVVAGLGGVAVLVAPQALAGLGRAPLAQLAVLAGALSYAFAGVYGRRFRRLGVDPVVTATGQVTASALVMVPLALAVEHPFALPVPPAPVLAALAGLALLSTALAYVLYFRLLARVGATNLLLVTFLIPVSATALGVLFLGERPGWPEASGAALIALGLWLVVGRAPPGGS